MARKARWTEADTVNVSEMRLAMDLERDAVTFYGYESSRHKVAAEVADRACARVRRILDRRYPEKKALRSSARALGKAGGLKGGRARAATLSPERRSEIGSVAARKRWHGAGAKKGARP